MAKTIEVCNPTCHTAAVEDNEMGKSNVLCVSVCVCRDGAFVIIIVSVCRWHWSKSRGWRKAANLVQSLWAGRMAVDGRATVLSVFLSLRDLLDFCSSWRRADSLLFLKEDYFSFERETQKRKNERTNERKERVWECIERREPTAKRWQADWRWHSSRDPAFPTDGNTPTLPTPRRRRRRQRQWRRPTYLCSFSLFHHDTFMKSQKKLDDEGGQKKKIIITRKDGVAMATDNSHRSAIDTE